MTYHPQLLLQRPILLLRRHSIQPRIPPQEFHGFKTASKRLQPNNHLPHSISRAEFGLQLLFAAVLAARVRIAMIRYKLLRRPGLFSISLLSSSTHEAAAQNMMA